MSTYLHAPMPYGPNVRVLCKPASPPSCDLVVQVRDPKQPEGWRDIKRFNDMANDFAYVDASTWAQNTRRKLLEGESV